MKILSDTGFMEPAALAGMYTISKRIAAELLEMTFAEKDRLQEW